MDSSTMDLYTKARTAAYRAVTLADLIIHLRDLGILDRAAYRAGDLLAQAEQQAAIATELCTRVDAGPGLSRVVEDALGAVAAALCAAGAATPAETARAAVTEVQAEREGRLPSRRGR